jgi:HlyD family secretion protein
VIVMSPAASPAPMPAKGPVEYPSADPWIRIGFVAIFATLGALTAWAGFSNITGAVIGAGIVTVETNIKTVQHLDGGIVAELLVKNGDRVQEGDTLMRLDDTSAKSNLGIINARLGELYIQRARLEAETKGAARIDLPADVARDAASDPRMATFLASQQSLFAARRNRQGGEAGLLMQQRAQLNEQVTGLTSELESRNRQSTLIKREIESVRPLLEQGLYTMTRMLSLERESARLEGEIGRLRGDIARVKGAISENEGKIQQIQKEMLQQVSSEQREAQGKIAELEEQKVAIEDKLKRIEIKAPRSGYVHNLAIHTVGGVVSPANPIMEVIPEEDRLIVEAKVSPNDIEQVVVGHTASVRFPAFNQRTTPVIDGKVVKRSAASITDKNPAMAAAGPYFTVTIEIAAAEIANLGEGKKLIPGMQAEVYIETEKRTILSYLVKPFTDYFGKAFRER